MTYPKLFVVACLVGLAGCDAPGFTLKAKAPTGGIAKPAVGTTRLTSATMPPGGVVPGPQRVTVFTGGLGISDLIAAQCGIVAREAVNATTPTFDYDSAALAPADRDILAEVARCMTEGALRGRDVVLIGRTDARGEAEYNMALGDSRASSVHRYLIDLGVGRERLRATSRGELDASGADEAGWARDRRVDIELAL